MFFNKKKKETDTVLQKDARILREALAGLYRKVPAVTQKQIHLALLRYAGQVKEYCRCPERSFVDSQGGFVCLDCGQVHKKAKGVEPKLVK